MTAKISFASKQASELKNQLFWVLKCQKFESSRVFLLVYGGTSYWPFTV